MVVVGPTCTFRLIIFKGRLMFLIHGFYFKTGLVPASLEGCRNSSVNCTRSWDCQGPHTAWRKFQGEASHVGNRGRCLNRGKGIRFPICATVRMMWEKSFNRTNRQRQVAHCHAVLHYGASLKTWITLRATGEPFLISRGISWGEETPLMWTGTDVEWDFKCSRRSPLSSTWRSPAWMDGWTNLLAGLQIVIM